MRGIFFWMAVVALFLPLPTPASNPPAHIWPSVFQSISELPDGPDRLPQLLGEDSKPNGYSGEIRGLELPFPFEFFDGETYTQINIGAKGYITLGGWSGATFAAEHRPDRLLLPTRPDRAIAAWWSDHICWDTGSILTKVLGEAPHRVFIVEWKDCSRAIVNYSAGLIYASAAIFQTQIWLEEGSGVVQVRYGAIKDDLSEPSLQSGYGWGLKTSSVGGFIGPNPRGELNGCYPTVNYGGPRRDCLHDDFPSFSTIQYGRSRGAEPIAKVEEVVDVSAEGGSLNLSLWLEWTNVGDQASAPAGAQLFLQPKREMAPGEEESFELGRLNLEDRLAPGERALRSYELEAEGLKSGTYFLCALVDREPQALPPLLGLSCSPETIIIGADLVGAIEGPVEGFGGGEASLSLQVQNVGTAAGAPFAYRVRMLPIGGDAREPTEEILVGTHPGLAAGEKSEWELEVFLPSPIRAERYEFELELNHDGAMEEAARDNNRATSPQAMVNLRPRLVLARPLEHPRFNDRCYYEEEVQVSFEICNEGMVPASGFQPGLLMGEEQLSFLSDRILAALPPHCEVDDDCAVGGGKVRRCLGGSCRVECEVDSECAGPLSCRPDPRLEAELARSGVKSCMNYLGDAGAPETERCAGYELQGRIPPGTEELGGVLRGSHRLHVVDDILLSLSQSHVDVMSFGPIECLEALPDLIPVALEPLGPLVAGKEVELRSRFENIGFQSQVEVRFAYGYFLIPLEPELRDWIPLEPLEPTETSVAGTAPMEKRERVRIGADLRPGSYRLGLVVDPDQRVRELKKENNRLVSSESFYLHPRGLQIATERLPRALRGLPYHHPLVGSGAVGRYGWSALELPQGMELSADGLLFGVPPEAGSFAFRVRLEAATEVVERQLALQVIEASSPLEVATKTLPLALRGSPYGVPLGGEGGALAPIRLVAKGGSPPMRWELDPLTPGNRLPQGLEGPNAEGEIGGVPAFGALSREFVVRVTDALGNQATRRLAIQVVDEGTLSLRQPLLPVGTSGEGYRGCLDAVGGLGELSWEVQTATLPAGLFAEAQGGQLCLGGIPTSCGVFEVSVKLEDQTSQRIVEKIHLIVECGSLRLDDRSLQPIRRGETAAFQLGAIPSVEPRFRLASGVLPEGLVLLPTGRIEGTVSEAARIGSYDLMLELEDAEGRRGLHATSLQLEGEGSGAALEPSSPLSGCTSSGAGGSAAWLLALAWLGLWRGRTVGAGDVSTLGGGTTSGGGDKPPSSEGSSTTKSQPTTSFGQRWGRGISLFGLAAVLSAGWLGCSGEDPTHEGSRCAGVLCEGGMQCDEADGLCKCGGPLGKICGELERCVGDLFPQCVSPLCDFVACERGMSCHPRLGECLCGEERCGEEELCVEGRCRAVAHCERSGCERGMSCDALDGSCKCGEGTCDPLEICMAGQCVTDPCAGVSCGANSSCNPTDGVCRCGSLEGEICNSGEACVSRDEGFFCDVSTLCDLASCGGGAVCDPDDGSCRCGGVGSDHPICTDDEVCIEGRCRGGLLCEPAEGPTICERGSSCDPGDGRCRCGGAGGEECSDTEICVHLEEGASCLAACSLYEFPSGCAAGEACYPIAIELEVFAYCSPEGYGQLGGRCLDASDCRGGLNCSPDQLCTQTCDLRDGEGFCGRIGVGLVCKPFFEGGTLGRCE